MAGLCTGPSGRRSLGEHFLKVSHNQYGVHRLLVFGEKAISLRFYLFAFINMEGKLYKSASMTDIEVGKMAGYWQRY